MTVKDVRMVNVGQWVRTKWRDAGCLDCVVIHKEKNRRGYPSFRGFFPASNICDTFDGDQVTKIGSYLDCDDSGLD